MNLLDHHTAVGSLPAAGLVAAWCSCGWSRILGHPTPEALARREAHAYAVWHKRPTGAPSARVA